MSQSTFCSLSLKGLLLKYDKYGASVYILFICPPPRVDRSADSFSQELSATAWDHSGAPAEGTVISNSTWLQSLGTALGNTNWLQSLGTVNSNCNWLQSLGIALGNCNWLKSLVTVISNCNWLQSLGTVPDNGHQQQ